MLSLHKPSAAAIQTFREAQAKLGLTYGSAGITAGRRLRIHGGPYAGAAGQG